MLAEQRTWGDGGGDKRVHVIADIVYRPVRPMLDCRCGARIEAEDAAALERAWDAHRGLTTSVHERVVHERADNAEVDAFMGRLTGETGGLNPRIRQPDPANFGVVGDLDAAFDMLERLSAMQARCTCTDTSDILTCPNYVAGDEEPLGGDE